MDGVGDELGDEDVVVDAVADAPANDADGESEGRNSGNEILFFCVSANGEMVMHTGRGGHLRRGR